MKHWRKGVFVLASAAILLGVGAGGRAAIWANPAEGGEFETSHPTEATAPNQSTMAGTEDRGGATRVQFQGTR